VQEAESTPGLRPRHRPAGVEDAVVTTNNPTAPPVHQYHSTTPPVTVITVARPQQRWRHDGDHAKSQLGLAAGAQTGAGRWRYEGEIAMEDELEVHRPAAAADSAGDGRNSRRTRVSLGGSHGCG
jgi:hypothetical protein